MSNDIVTKFQQSLTEAEATGKLDALLALFADDAELESMSSEHSSKAGKDKHSFWREYLDTFQSVRSQFSHAVQNGTSAALEWRAEGALKSGRTVSYKGVSVLEFAGGKVTRFRTYYDTAAFSVPSGEPAPSPDFSGTLQQGTSLR